MRVWWRIAGLAFLAACGDRVEPDPKPEQNVGRTTHALGPVLFADDFNRTSGLGPDWLVAGGAFVTDGSVARATASSSYAFWRGTPDPASSVEVRLARPSSTYAGVILRASPADPRRDHYAVYVGPDSRVSIARRDAWSYSYLATGPTFPSGTHRLTATATGSAPVTVVVHVDGQELLRTSDASSTRRSAGLAGIFDYSGQRTAIDDFRVYGPDGLGAGDAGVPRDGGSPDAGASTDAGSPTDAGGPPDAGTSADAGVPDAGVPDAGAPDAGRDPDAGSATDAGLTILFRDPFNRSGGLGASWSVASGAFAVNGTAAIGTAATSYAVWTGQPDPNGAVSVLVSPPTAASHYGVILRANRSSPSRDHYAGYVAPDGTVNIARRTGYSYAYLAEGPHLPPGLHELSLSATGTSPVRLSLKVDGQEWLTATDHTPPPGHATGLAGIFDYAGKAQPLDDFTVLGSAAGGPSSPAADAGSPPPPPPAPDAGPVPVPDAGTPTPGGDNPITRENALTGDPGWRLTREASRSDLAGYFSTDSAIAGDVVSAHVHSRVQATVTWELFRIGWYGGAGARSIARGEFLGTPQPSCPRDSATGLVECAWASAFSFRVPSDWVSGVHVAKLTRSDGPQTLLIFTLRDARRADVIIQQSVTTWQAYNEYGGESLYTTQLGLPQGHALKVSLARPYDQTGGQFFDFEADLVRWIESQGFDATYVTNLDFSRDPELALRGRVFISVGHDEYWSLDQRDGLERARASGVSQAYLSANTAYWQIRVEAAPSGPHRRIVCYKDQSDPLVGTPTATVRWRDPPLDRPENALIGVMSVAWQPVNVPLAIDQPDHWLFDGTGLGQGDTIGLVVGYEADQRFSNGLTPPGTERLASHPLTNVYGVPYLHELTLYQAPSGAWVLGSGTIEWAWALYAEGLADARIQRITANFLARAGARPASPRPLVTQDTWSRADLGGATGTVTTVAGIPDLPGSEDGLAGQATFTRPAGVAVASDGTVYVSDAATHRIRRIRDGQVTTLAGSSRGFTDGAGTAARLNQPMGLAVGRDGYLYVADTGNHCIRRVSPEGVVSTWAGRCGSRGSVNGSLTAARFSGPQDIAFGPSGAAYVADSRNNAIRKVAAGEVTTLAASPDGRRGVFHVPNALAVAADEAVYVVDSGHRAIKRVSTSGSVSSILARAPVATPYRLPDGAGGGFADGPLDAALAMPGYGLEVIGASIYFADAGNDRIRRIDLETQRVSTVAGSGRARCEDGPAAGAGFVYPQGIAAGNGALYVADSCGAIRRLTLP